MRFSVLTIFPAILRGALSESILGRAQERGLLRVDLVDIRDFAADRHRVVDDYSFGGGPGMVMKPEPIYRALESLDLPAGAPRLLLTPQGETFNQLMARELSASTDILMICGRYEGVDERVRQGLALREVSVGDFVLTGGEFAALVVIDAVARLLPGVLGAEDSPLEESFSSGLLEYPQYTRPARFRDMEVPEVLLSGDHARIARWRREQALEKTLLRRPDLLEKAELTEADREFLARLSGKEGGNRAPRRQEPGAGSQAGRINAGKHDGSVDE